MLSMRREQDRADPSFLTRRAAGDRDDDQVEPAGRRRRPAGRCRSDALDQFPAGLVDQMIAIRRRRRRRPSRIFGKIAFQPSTCLKIPIGFAILRRDLGVRFAKKRYREVLDAGA